MPSDLIKVPVAPRTGVLTFYNEIQLDITFYLKSSYM